MTARGLEVLRDGRVVVRGVDLDVPSGGVVAIVGRNGAGCSSLLEGIAGLLPRRGTIHVAGVDRSDASALEMARAGVVLAPQGGATFPGLRVADHLAIAGRGAAADAFVTPAIAALCADRADQLADTLSGGERRLLALALVALRAPLVALLDEPSEGVAPGLLPEFAAAVRALAQRCGVVLVEQRLDLVRDLADRVVVMDRGSIVGAGTFATLEQDGVLAEVLGP
jgi:branched-chain amino acid transport system ATP-binding protein